MMGRTWSQKPREFIITFCLDARTSADLDALMAKMLRPNATITRNRFACLLMREALYTRAERQRNKRPK